MANGTAWEGKVKLGIEESGLLSIRFLMRDADSILVQSISFHNIKPINATSKLSTLQTFTAIPSSIYSTGYADVFDYYDPDTTRTNILEIEQFDLDRGIINHRLNAFYCFYRGSSEQSEAQPWRDTMRITDMTFTYQR